MYKNNHLGKKIGKKNKNLPPTSQSKLLRSIQMRNYCIGCNDTFQSVIQSVEFKTTSDMEGEKYYLQEAINKCNEDHEYLCRNFEEPIKSLCIRNNSCNNIRLPLKMTQDELRQYIKDLGPAFCSVVMVEIGGRGLVNDCGNKPRPGAPSTEPIVDSTIYTRWKDAGGQCPNGGVKDPICSTGCRREKGSDITNGGTCY